MLTIWQGRAKSKIINYSIVTMISLYGFAMQDFKYKDISFFERVFIDTLAPLQEGVTNMNQNVSHFFDHYVFLISASKENVQLKKEILSLKKTIFDLQETQKENERLKALLKFGEDIPRQKVLAQVIGWDSSNKFRVLRVNKGRNAGIKLQSPVVTKNGLVGYVYRVSDEFADVLTILDQNNRVDGIVSRSRSHGIAEGYSGLKMNFKYVSRTDAIEVGDIVVTAGLGDIYPKGIRLGVVSYLEKENYKMTQYVELDPSVNFHKLEEVIILIKDSKKVATKNEKK